jgi:hypothetical protein
MIARRPTGTLSDSAQPLIGAGTHQMALAKVTLPIFLE